MKHFMHDCERCTFHGHMQGYDVYTCVSSVILRFGDDLNDYLAVDRKYIEKVAKCSSLWHSAYEFISVEAMA